MHLICASTLHCAMRWPPRLHPTERSLLRVANVQKMDPIFGWRQKSIILAVTGSSIMAGCGGSSSALPLFNVPPIPSAKSALVPPELTVSCPITNSSIDSLITKGTGLAFNGATFGSVGTYTYTLAEATARVSASDVCAPCYVPI